MSYRRGSTAFAITACWQMATAPPTWPRPGNFWLSRRRNLQQPMTAMVVNRISLHTPAHAAAAPCASSKPSRVALSPPAAREDHHERAPLPNHNLEQSGWSWQRSRSVRFQTWRKKIASPMRNAPLNVYAAGTWPCERLLLWTDRRVDRSCRSTRATLKSP